MTKFDQVLSNDELLEVFASKKGSGDYNALDVMRWAQEAVLTKLHEQEPLAWYVNNDITFDQQTADSWEKNLFIVKPLYENPSPSIVSDKTACISESGGNDRQLARVQPCGCVVCYCENQVQCLGCGAEHCGTHDLGEIPNPVYTNHFAGVRNMVECAKCGHPAIHYLVMDNLGYPNKTPLCGDCTQEHEHLAQDTNEHEMRNFGGVYGLVSYHYEPLGTTQPDHIPDTGKMVFDPDSALTLAERTLSIDITESIAGEIIQFSRKLREKYAQADHIPDASKMIVPDGWQLVPKQATNDMYLSFCHVRNDIEPDEFREAYRAVLAAAPKYTGDK